MSTETRKAQHTPGPWTTFPQHFSTVPDGEDPDTYVGANGKAVCTVSTWGADYANDTEAQANARLIAAAPEMLEALRALFDHCAMVHKHWGENSNQREADEAISAARALLQRFEIASSEASKYEGLARDTRCWWRSRRGRARCRVEG